jgi:hypothetical protein
MAHKASAFDGGCNPAQQAQSLWELLYLLKDHTPSALRGEARLRGPESCTLLQERERRHLRCARLRRAPRQRRSSPAGASTRSARASARTRSRFGHQDAQTPPSPFVGEGKTPPPVRAPPARTPAETLQPRRGFHALSEGFSPHPLSFRTSGRPNAPFSPCGRGGWGDEGQQEKRAGG